MNYISVVEVEGALHAVDEETGECIPLLDSQGDFITAESHQLKIDQANERPYVDLDKISSADDLRRMFLESSGTIMSGDLSGNLMSNLKPDAVSVLTTLRGLNFITTEDGSTKMLDGVQAKNYWWSSKQVLAEASGVRKDNFSKVIKTLVDRGLVRWIHHTRTEMFIAVHPHIAFRGFHRNQLNQSFEMWVKTKDKEEEC